MKQLLLGSLLICTITACKTKTQSHDLFNGKDLKGWHMDVPEMDTNASARSPFIVRNGMLVSLGKPQGHLITDAVYQDYRLEVEYRFPSTPGNSGILLHTSTPR